MPIMILNEEGSKDLEAANGFGILYGSAQSRSRPKTEMFNRRTDHDNSTIQGNLSF